jgi:hypothetical protein
MEIPPSGARGYHLTNVILHGATVVMLLLALNALTCCFWRSVIVAAIFAVHPLRLESVAWITERKDVLSGVFAFAAVWAYARYGHASMRVLRPALHWFWLALTCVLLILALMSKSTPVTLPFVLLLLDYWPLKRIDLTRGLSAVMRRIVWLVIEKIPLFLITAGSCWITMHGGRRAVADLPHLLRVTNAIVSYVRYIGKMFWPVDLCLYYPLPGVGGADAWSRMQVIGALGLLMLISLVALALVRRKPYLIVGWLWFVGMLVPVIGLLQVGNQGLADRFSYLPGIGLSVAVVWLVADALGRSLAARIAMACLAAAAIVGESIATRTLLPTWLNTDAVYQRALQVTQKNRAVHAFYGDYLFHEKRYPEALAQFRSAADLAPDDAMPPFKLGFIYAAMKEYYKAQEQFEVAVRLDPGYADAYFNIAVMRVRRGQPDAALPILEKALELKPDAENYKQLLREIRSGVRTSAGSDSTATRP